MNWLKISEIKDELDNPNLSQKERTKLLVKLYKLENKGDFSFKLAILGAFLSPLLLLLLL